MNQHPPDPMRTGDGGRQELTDLRSSRKQVRRQQTPPEDIVQRARHAAAAGGYAGLAVLLADHPLQVWFGVPPGELAAMFRKIPNATLRDEPVALLLVEWLRALGLASFSDQPVVASSPESTHWFRQWQKAAEAVRFRIGGDPVAAYQLIREMPDQLARIPSMSDDFRALRGILLTQKATTAMLAGEFRDALSLLSRVLLASPVAGMDFLVREVGIRSALLHALYGDPDLARSHYRDAGIVPRTQSWVEQQLDSEEQLVAALLLIDTDPAAARSRIHELTMQQMGEMWPFYLLALQRAAMACDDEDQGVVRERIAALREAGFESRACSGVPETALATTAFLDAVFAGDHERARLEAGRIDSRFWLTRAISALLNGTPSGAREAAAIAHAVREHTEGLLRAERWRILILAFATHAIGDIDEAVELLGSMSNGLSRMERALIRRFSPTLADRGAQFLAPSDDTRSEHGPAPAHLGRLPQGWVVRDRVLSLFDAAATAAVIEVTGTAGYGKSTAVLDWVRQRPHSEQVIWFAADEQSREPLGFWTSFHHSLQTAGIVREDGPWGHSGEDVVPQSLDYLISRLMTALHRTPRTVRIVIDDLHAFADDTVDTLITFAAQVPTLRLIVISRQSTAFTAGSLPVRSSVAQITQSDLAFTETEAESLHHSVHTTVPLEEIGRLNSAAQGNPLSMRVALAISSEDASAQTRLIRARRFLINELLSTYSEQQREWAILLAFPPTVPPELAARITGADDAQQLLSSFAAAGIGELDRDGNFTFHDLIREHLLQVAPRSVPTGRIRHACITSASWFQPRRGHAVTALSLYVQADAFKEVWPLFVRHFNEMTLNAPARVEEILVAAKGQRFDSEPGAVIALGLLSMARHTVHAPELVEQLHRAVAALEETLADGSISNDERIHASTALYAGYRALRDHDAANEASERFIAFLEKEKLLGSPALSAVLLQVARGNIITQNFGSAMRIIDAFSVGGPYVAHRTTLRAYIHAIRGEIPASDFAIESIAESEVQPWQDTPKAIGWHLARLLRNLEGEHPEQVDAEVRALSERFLPTEHWPYIIWVHALAFTLNDSRTGLEYLVERRRSMMQRTTSPTALALLEAGIADLALAAGNLELAQGILSRSPAGTEHPAMKLSLARLSLTRAEQTSAHPLRQLLDAPDLWPRHRAQALLLLATIEARADNSDAAGRYYNAAHATLSVHELRTPVRLAPAAELRELANRAKLAPLPGGDQPSVIVWGRRDLGFTPREMSVLRELASARSLREIANEHFLSYHTIKSQAQSIYRKLGVQSRTAAVTAAREAGLL